MAHLDGDEIHAYVGQATDVQVRVITTEDETAFSALVFTAADGTISKSGLTAVNDPAGGAVLVDVALLDTDLTAATQGTTAWQLIGTVTGDSYVIARGFLRVDPQPTTAVTAWIGPADIEAVYPGEDITPGFIGHIQALAETVIGTQTSPTVGLKAEMVELTYRKWRVTNAQADGLTQEAIGSYSYSIAGSNGLGLSNREKRNLRAAVGRGGPFILQTHRDVIETAPRRTDTDSWLEGAL